MTAGAGSAARQVTTSAPFQLVARAGMVTYGLVHLLLAWIAVQVALGGADRADKNGALQSIAAGTGVWLLWLTAVGLGAAALWQLIEAIAARGRGGEAVRHRMTYVGEAILFGYLAFAAGKIAAGGSTSSTDGAQRGLVGRLLAEPWGPTLVAILGAAVVFVALFIMRHGLRKRFLRHLDLPSHASPVAVRLGQVGYVALGAVYGIAGVLVIVAALTSDPAKATGLDVALKTLVQQPFGVTLLLLVAAGLTAFAAFCLYDARYRRTS